MSAYELVRSGVIGLGPRVDALKAGDTAIAHGIAAEMRVLEQAAAHMTTLGAQIDAGHRGAVRAAINRANIAFGLTVEILIGSLLLSLRAVVRQAAGLDTARRRSEALSGELGVALARAEAGARA